MYMCVCRIIQEGERCRRYLTNDTYKTLIYTVENNMLKRQSILVLEKGMYTYMHVYIYILT